ncbi:MAG TPA: thiamine ABC transporter substrate-binding protein [Acidimicrobiales bacterium]|nr:thiamine ABC transporter substrate-binding protein [Acidimicrobiales bacterium]
MRPVRVVAGLLAVSLAACGGANDGKKDDDTSGPPRQTVRLLTHDSFAASKDVLAAFTARTGITIELVQAGDAGAMVNQAVLTRGKPLADVLFGVDNTFLSRALDADLFVPYAPAALATVPDDHELDARHRVTPVDHGEVCVNYDKKWFADHAVAVPQTLEDLARPDYRGLLVVENPATSSPGLAFLVGTVARFGEPGWKEYWRRLRSNDVRVDAGWEEAYNGAFSGSAGKGDRPLVVSYASSPPAEVVFADPTPTDAPTGVVEDTCVRQIEFAGILKGTRHAAAARRVVDFLLSKEFQEDMPLQMFVFPVLAEAALPAVFAKYAARPMTPLDVPAPKIGANRDRWIREWTDTVIR